MLKGKAAVVTGSTSGIGLGIARALAAQGADIMLNGFGEADTIAEIQKELEAEHGVQVRHHVADMSKPDEIDGMIDDAEQAFDGVDILVNNAGIQHTDPVEDFPTERWDAVIAVNLSAVFHATRAVLPHMRRRNWGRIVNTASVHGLVASMHKAAYVAAKHGVVGLTKVVGLETARTGITCNAVCPGWVRTPLVERQIESLAARESVSIEKAAQELLGPKQPSQQFVTPEQIGAMVVFLCSEAAEQITGTALAMDGGWTAQ